ncbi:hypothetical protein KDL01_07050, partial [Actinospica durhamensis]
PSSPARPHAATVRIPAAEPGALISVAATGSADAAFALSPTHTLVYAAQQAGPGGWSSFNAVPGQPSGAAGAPAAVTDTAGDLEVFDVLADGAIAGGRQTSAGWQWSVPATGAAPPGTPTGDLSAITRPDGRIEVFVRLSDGSVAAAVSSSATGSGGWSAWTELGGSLAGRPVPFDDAGGDLQLYGRSSAGTLVWTVWNGSSWSGWSTIAGPTDLAADPTPISNQDGGTEVFVTTGSGQVDHAWIDTSGQWAWGGQLAADNLGSTLTGQVAALRWPDGHLEVFARLADGRLAHAWQNSATGATGWSGWAPCRSTSPLRRPPTSTPPASRRCSPAPHPRRYRTSTSGRRHPTGRHRSASASDSTPRCVSRRGPFPLSF